MLDDALYHVKTFIHGPVCKGQIALDVIDEHFLIFFLAPASDPAVTDPAYLRSAAEDLAVPAEGGSGIEAIYARFKLDELAYLKMQGAKLRGDAGAIARRHLERGRREPGRRPHGVPALR